MLSQFDRVEQIYFALLIYSYAVHLRKGSYRGLPLSRSQNNGAYTGLSTVADDDDEVDDFYLLPVRAPPPPSGHGHTPSGSSISSFADFVSAPGRSRRLNQKAQMKSTRLANAKAPAVEEGDEVLFDEDEMVGGSHLKAGTDESTSASGSGGRTSAEEDGPSFMSSSNSARRASRVKA